MRKFDGRRIAARARARVAAITNRGLVVGERVIVGPRCRFIIDPGARVILGAGSEMDEGCTLAAYGASVITIGRGSFLGHHCTIAAHAAVTVGESTFLAELVSVRDHDHEPGKPPAWGHKLVDPVLIGDRVWLGAKVTILRGSSIGDGTVVGANAVVHGALPPLVMAAGVPARILKSLKT